MSLINDALRKARQAAAEHEARQPEAAFRAPKAYPSRGPGRRSVRLRAIRFVVERETAQTAG